MMMKFFSLVLALALTMSCFPSSQDLSDVTPRFQTTESSVLFFRNTRSVFYDFIEKPEASVELFYPGKPTSASSQPGYVWYLAYNRLQSKVMAFHESTPALESDPCAEIQWHWKQPEGATTVVATVRCPVLHPEENFEFLVRSYQQLNADRVPHIKTRSGQLKPLFADKENKRRFLRLVRDYLELVDLI